MSDSKYVLLKRMPITNVVASATSKTVTSPDGSAFWCPRTWKAAASLNAQLELCPAPSETFPWLQRSPASSKQHRSPASLGLAHRSRAHVCYLLAAVCLGSLRPLTFSPTSHHDICYEFTSSQEFGLAVRLLLHTIAFVSLYGIKGHLSLFVFIFLSLLAVPVKQC